MWITIKKALYFEFLNLYPYLRLYTYHMENKVEDIHYTFTISGYVLFILIIYEYVKFNSKNDKEK